MLKEKNIKMISANRNKTPLFKDKGLSNNTHVDMTTKWYDQVPFLDFEAGAKEFKQEELTKLTQEAKKCFDADLAIRKKKSSTEGWLHTALNKGTARDKANAGALLVESDPCANLQALNSLVAQCKAANKECLEVIDTLTELFINCLLPGDRKLSPLSHRGAEWDGINNSANKLPANVRAKILAYWHFEAELKDTYITFVRNLQSQAGIGLEITKCRVVGCVSKLLEGAPEQEQTLLSLLINKLGDPSHRVASKSIYHLTGLTHKHPNMCAVIVREAEKLLFRNNLPRKAQHYALCFLGQLGGNVHSDVAERLVRICFAFFKACVNKGEVESRTMTTILSCVRRALPQIKKEASTSILTEDLQATMYRLIHMTNIKVSLQALGLLMQVEQGAGTHSDRFYMALYKRLLDNSLATVAPSTFAIALHIVHKALLEDPQPSRAKAFIKRLLQISLYFPVASICGCLLVVSRLFDSRKDLSPHVMMKKFYRKPVKSSAKGVALEEASGKESSVDRNWLLEDSGDEVYEDVRLDEEKHLETEKTKTKRTKAPPSWFHAAVAVDANIVNFTDDVKNDDSEEKKEEITNIIPKSKNNNIVTKYDPYHRNPKFAGAEFSKNVELLKLREHYHPTVQLFAERIINGKSLDYSGDPLKDFSCAKFLERFSFKNPKQIDKLNANTNFKKHVYISMGSRGKNIHSLSEQNVTEEERFIFEFLEKRRNLKADDKVRTNKDDGDDESDVESIGDDEFDDYLDKMVVGNKKADIDFMDEVGDSLKHSSAKSKKRKGDDDSESEASLSDDNVVNEEAADDSAESGDDIGKSDNFSDLDSEDEDIVGDFDDENDSEIEFSDGDNDVLLEPKQTNKRGKKRKGENLESLFASADDFAHLLDEAGSSKQKLGSSSAVFNKDKSSEKQMKWEEKRHQKGKVFRSKKFKKSK